MDSLKLSTKILWTLVVLFAVAGLVIVVTTASRVNWQILLLSAILLVALLGAAVVVRKITEPLHRLGLCAQALAARDSTSAAAAQVDEALVPIAARADEIGQLALAFRHMIREVTRREQGLLQAEETLRQSEARMVDENQRLVAAIPSILIGLDPEGRITRWNHAAEKVLGLTSEAALGRTAVSLPVAWDGRLLMERVQECLQARRSLNLDDFPLTRPDGHAGILGISLTPVMGRGDCPHGVLLLASDITERRHLESQLAQAQKLESIGQLAAGIAHEINTPIQFIGDNVTFLRGAFSDVHEVLDKHGRLLTRARARAPLDEAIAEVEQAVATADLAFLKGEVPRAIEQTLDGVGRVAKIVRAMRDFSHPGGEGMVASDLNKLIENTITVAKNEWKYVADMVTALDPSLPLVPCLAGEFNQVILNLIVNAAHAIDDRLKTDGEAKGIITISTRAREGEVEIRVSDTGTGIPEAAQPKVFDPFFTTKPVGKGTGQGLAIARAVIVKKHRGKLRFETEMGKGTSFIIAMPTGAE